MYKGTQRHIIGSITAKTQNLQSLFGPLAGVLFELQGRFSQSIFACFYEMYLSQFEMKQFFH